MKSKRRFLSPFRCILLVAITGYFLFNPDIFFYFQKDTELLGSQQVLTAEDSGNENRPPHFLRNIDCKGRRPAGLSVYNGSLFVSYRNLNMISILTLQGEAVGYFDPYPKAKIDIVDLNHDEEGNLYLVDARNKVVMVFDKELVFRYTFPQAGKDSSSQSHLLKMPAAININNNVAYITDVGASLVQAFMLTGEYLMQIKSPTSEQEGARAWHPFKSLQAKDGRVIVSDMVAKRIYIFGCDGSFAHNFENPPSLKLENPMGMTFDNVERVHVLDGGTLGQIFVYDNYGRYLFVYGEDGSGSERNMKNPYDIAFAPSNNLVFVSDPANKQIKVWSIGLELDVTEN